MDYNTMKGLLDDPMAKTKITLKEGDKSVTMERTPQEHSMTANGLLGGMIGGMSPSPVADDKMINVTSGEFVVNQPAAQKYSGLLEDINNEGREMLARGGYTGSGMMDHYAEGGKTALSNKISKIYKEGYTAPGQAYAIAKNMGYAEGGEVGHRELIGDPEEDAMTIMENPIFQKLVGEARQFGYDPASVPAHIFNSPLGKLFDTPEKQEALLLANAHIQSDGYAEGGKIEPLKKSTRGSFTASANAAGMGVQEFARHVLAAPEGEYSPLLRKRANFARNAAGWNKAYGGMVEGYANGGSVQSDYHKSKYGLTQQSIDEVIAQYKSGALAGNEAIAALTANGTMTGQEALALLQGVQQAPAAGGVTDSELDDLLGGGDDTVETAPRQAPVDDGGEGDVGGYTPSTSGPGGVTVAEGPGGILSNKEFDFILEKSRGLAQGKGFGGAKLGARQYVDELYAPAPGTSGSQGRASSRSFNLEWRDPETGELKVRAGRKNANGDFELQDESGNWVPAHTVAGTNDIRVAPRSADPGVEAGAGGIPNAVSFNDATGIPSFEFRRESEAKAYGYAVRAIAADAELSSLEGQVEPEKIASLYGGLAQWASRNANAKITAAVLNDYLKDAGLQQYSRQMTKFLQAILRNDTGAAYTGTEIADYLSAFGIAPGTVITPETLASFQNGRKQEIATSIARTGSAAPYLSGLLAGEYPVPGLGNLDTGGSVASDGQSGTTSGGVGWKIT